jgi:hypothetical protein
MKWTFCAQFNLNLFASVTLIIHSKNVMMVFRSIVALATIVVPLVNCAPLTLQERQTPNGVPDYVLKYGTYRLQS